MRRPPARFTEQITFLNCSDLEASARFYGDLLGLDLALDQGTCRIFRVASGGCIGLCGGRKPPPRGVILTLVCQDVPGWAQHLRAAGLDVDGPKHNPDYDIEQLFVRDPDGALVEIQRFLDPRWQPNQ